MERPGELVALEAGGRSEVSLTAFARRGRAFAGPPPCSFSDCRPRHSTQSATPPLSVSCHAHPRAFTCSDARAAVVAGT